MKSLLIAASMFASSLVLADGIKVDNRAYPVKVDRVSTEIVGQQGFPSVKVTIQATFGNPCAVPRAGELIEITQYQKNYDELIITLGQMPSQTVCPAVYSPTPAAIDLGVFTRPNDGLFKKIIVNGVEASN